LAPQKSNAARPGARIQAKRCMEQVVSPWQRVVTKAFSRAWQ
jgi:hypothetical protein